MLLYFCRCLSRTIPNVENPAFRLCHYDYKSSIAMQNDGIFAVYSYPWAVNVSTPKLINPAYSKYRLQQFYFGSITTKSKLSIHFWQ